MGRRDKPLTDRDEMRAAARRAAHNAVHGTREQRSGRFLGETTDWDRWDEQIEDGKLDKLLEEAKQDYERGDGSEL